jgi:hypothetical protein
MDKQEQQGAAAFALAGGGDPLERALRREKQLVHALQAAEESLRVWQANGERMADLVGQSRTLLQTARWKMAEAEARASRAEQEARGLKLLLGQAPLGSPIS